MSSSPFDAAQIADYRRVLDLMAQDRSDKSDGGKRRSNALPPPSPATISAALNVKSLTVEWLAGDGSDRCYYRLLSPELSQSLVLMQLSGSDAQALKDDGYDWIKIAQLLAGQEISVPRVVTTLPDHAAIIIEDYGDVMLEGQVFALAEKNDLPKIRRLYGQAADIIANFLAIPQSPTATWCRRGFDEERFVWELNFFVQKYAAPVAGITLTPTERRKFDEEVSLLSRTLAETSHYFVHRDFHSRNIMAKGERLAVIDFQDARLGPASYDLVSLCFDSYVPFTAATRSMLLQDGIAAIKRRVGESIALEVERLWKPMLLQRQLKAIGSFGFLTLDKQRGDYLRYVDPALRTLEEQGVGDDRWPLLSREVLRRMRVALSRKPDEGRH